MRVVPVLCVLSCACHAARPPADASTDTDRAGDTDPTTVDTDDTDRLADSDSVSTDTDRHSDTDAVDPFAARVVSFTPGQFAGFGQDHMPDVVLGPPVGKGPTAGSLDVVSLGESGEIVLAFDDLQIVDGDGPDLIVFENAFPGWAETGEVSVSDDGTTWSTWPCASDDPDHGFPGCAGVHAVLSSPTNGIDPTDPAVAGGDDFDLADLGLAHARYVRIRDSGANALNGLGYAGTTGGFDLDAVAVVHGARP